jgi:hypothetical protein
MVEQTDSLRPCVIEETVHYRGTTALAALAAALVVA